MEAGATGRWPVTRPVIAGAGSCGTVDNRPVRGEVNGQNVPPCTLDAFAQLGNTKHVCNTKWAEQLELSPQDWPVDGVPQENSAFSTRGQRWQCGVAQGVRKTKPGVICTVAGFSRLGWAGRLESSSCPVNTTRACHSPSPSRRLTSDADCPSLPPMLSPIFLIQTSAWL